MYVCVQISSLESLVHVKLFTLSHSAETLVGLC